jgi:hypothetical protein
MALKGRAWSGSITAAGCPAGETWNLPIGPVDGAIIEFVTYFPLKLGQLLVSYIGENVRLAQGMFHNTNQSGQSVLVAPAQNIRHGSVDLHANLRLLK